MSLEKEFEKNWKSLSDDHDTIDDITDHKIWTGIERKIRKKNPVKKIYWIAAVLIPLFTLLSIYESTQFSKEEKKSSLVNIFETSGAAKTYTLPDGSQIELKPNSKLVLNENFGKKSRDVSFTGQGIFRVAKDKERPFRINAGEFKVQVLGTEFYLDQKSEEKKVELFEGKVKIQHGSTITYLLPKEVWLHDKNRADYHYYHPEKQKSFEFNRANYADAVTELEKTYNIHITYPKTFRNKKVSGSFTGNLNEILSVISFPFNLKPQKINDKEIQLK
ncbi:FecR family protein [Chryseobacterium sp. Tr-659]|uniref:FecR family protein n=1 Tax=Chryseobacterium sp. Tr-659 TaxID=2608340 RepID=UPI00141FAE99|nr:FecR family protein [Chryseobacterium sp. Tr-659]NIF06531.1 FecR family protein [Chryseobacterium sp. Tr-659]